MSDRCGELLGGSEPTRAGRLSQTRKGISMKARISIDRVMEAIEEDDCVGFCTACGAEQGGCEPDAHEYECESCGACKVYGAEELLMLLA